MTKVSRPHCSKEKTVGKEAVKAYNVDEVHTIMSSLEHEPLKWRTFITLMMDTGCRRGKICGLQWADISFEKKEITVRHNLQYSPKIGVFLTNPKSGKIRIVDVGDDTILLLRQLRATQAEKAISKFCFTQDGSPEPMFPQSPTRYFKKFSQKYGIPDFHPHILRHTSATLAILNGSDIVSVSGRLGHADTSTTLKMYSHANAESIRKAGQTVRDALKGKAE